MKITLTLEEIKSLVAVGLNLTRDFTLEIENDSDIRYERREVTNLLNDMARFAGPDGKIILSQKIAAIKQFRTHFFNPDGSQFLCGLALSKFTIENWQDFVQKLNEYGQLPTVRHDSWVWKYCGQGR